jgi:phage repressor protein C with HTH and peptisase S24 domain
MDLTKIICTRIKKLIDNSPKNQKEIAEALGITPASVNQMLGGHAKLPLKRAVQIMDLLHIAKSEKDEIIAMINERDTGIPMSSSQYTVSSNYSFRKKTNAEPIKIDPEGKVFPVISEAAAVSCNTSYIPIVDFAIENSDELRYFDLGLPGDIAIRITGESMLPWYPPGTLVLIRPNARPQNGQRVIAILGDGEVVFKIFSETKEHIHLLSINDHDGEDMHFAKDDYQAIRNLFVVIQSVRDELRLDQAMDEAGIKHRWQNKIKDYE